MTAVCQALRQHPSLNANVDDEAGEILIKSAINLGCAVDTEHGLMVPVIPAADRLSIVQLADAVQELAAACRNRTIERQRLIGGTFTISNVGSYGGLFATPIINYPEVAILAVGRGVERVLTRNGQFYAGRVLPLSLSCDHRVVDGAEGARFVNTVRQYLESPERLLHGRGVTS
jgi:pyruvate dehydrogenase E2 component (dihydrolipoamide acetyltransferase)